MVPGPRPDSLRVRVAGGQAVRFRVMAHARLSQERALSLPGRWSGGGSGGGSVLIATNRLTEEARAVLRRKGVSWVERDTGVGYLHERGLLIDLRPPHREERSVPRIKGIERPARLRGRSGLVIETLLLQWANHWDSIALADIAAASNVSKQLASRVLRRLEAGNLLRAVGSGPRKTWSVIDASAILDKWADEERTTPEYSAGLYVWTRSQRDLYSKVLKISGLGVRWALGGVSAANLHTPTLTTEAIPEVWIPAEVAPEKVADQLGGEIVSTGANIRLMQASGDLALHHATPKAAPPNLPSSVEGGQGLMLVSIPRAYIEARAASGRGPDVAQNVRRMFLSSANHELKTERTK